ncbi:MAG: ABC transporter ATP-binding protein [Acidimicrobiales bacterium]
MTNSAPLVALVDITKRFGGVVACDRVNLSLHPGEIHGVLGQNGAGKSTLMKILIGLVLPESGEIHIRGVAHRIHDPQVAAALGIAMVHQHFSLVEPLRVWENVVLGEVSGIDAARARTDVREIGERYGLEVDPDARVSDLTAGQRQRVEIIKCLRRGPSILVFDEPTSVLTPAESLELFAVLRRVVQEEQRAVALVSHKLDEILHATDRVTIMRSGRVVASIPTSEATAPSLARAMVGRDVVLRSQSAAAFGLVEMIADELALEAPTVGAAAAAPAVLKIVDACARGAGRRTLLDGLSLEVHPGEIVGIAGVEGNGQAALGDLLSSLLELESGTVEVNGEAVPTGKAGAMADAGVGVIPEDRHASGCVLEMTVAENLVLDAPHALARHGLLDRRAVRDRAARLIDEFDIQASSPEAPMSSLSGGNQQRVVLARELSRQPKVLVAAQPTRGLDVGAIEYMGQRLRAAADAGVGVLLVSSELEEILALSDRVVVLYRGRIIGEMSRHDVDLERLGLLMGGEAA